MVLVKCKVLILQFTMVGIALLGETVVVILVSVHSLSSVFKKFIPNHNQIETSC